MPDYLKELKLHYQENKLIPFIGSGFSQTLGLPSWGELINLIALKLNYEPELFNIHGTPQQLAEYIEKFDPKLYFDFLHQVGINFNSGTSDEKRKSSIIHKTLGLMKFKSIYTTNFDHHIEEALKDVGKKVNRISTIADFLNSNYNYDCEVIKFHGTLEEPSTIILTETRYFDRMNLEEAVDQRLRADLLSNSFVFIGYSFNDANIRYIWYKINKLRQNTKSENIPDLRPSYFVDFGIGPIQPVLLQNWKINVISLDPINKIESLNLFLEGISH